MIVGREGCTLGQPRNQREQEKFDDAERVITEAMALFTKLEKNHVLSLYAACEEMTGDAQAKAIKTLASHMIAVLCVYDAIIMNRIIDERIGSSQ